MGNTVATNVDSGTQLDISRVYELSPAQTAIVLKAVQLLTKSVLPEPDSVRRLLGEPLQKSYITAISILLSRSDPVAKLVHDAGYQFGQGQWTSDQLTRLLYVIHIFSTHLTIPSLVDALYEFEMEELLDKNPDTVSYWQQLTSEISVLPYDSIVERKYGSEGVKILHQAFAASPYPDQYDQAVQAGMNMRWTQRSIQRKITLVKLSASHMGRAKYMERVGLAYQKYLRDQREHRMLNITIQRIRPPIEWRKLMQYGIFRVDIASHTKDWENRFRRHKNELAAAGLNSWEQYIQAQSLWESKVPKSHLHYLPPQPYPRVTLEDFINNWKRLRQYHKWAQGEKTHDVGYPCLSQANAFFPYTTAELDKLAGRKGRTTRAKLCQDVRTFTSVSLPYSLAVSSFKQLNSFHVSRPLPSWSTASVEERVWSVWINYYRGAQYVPAAVTELYQLLMNADKFKERMMNASTDETGLLLIRRYLKSQPTYIRKAYPAVLRGSLFPTKDRLDYILNNCDLQLDGKLDSLLQSQEYRQWLTGLLLTVDTVEDGCELVKEAFFPILAKQKTDNFSKYVQLLDISGVDISDESLMTTRYNALSAEQKAQLSTVDSIESGLRWLRQLTTPQEYSNLSAKEKWRTVIQLGLAKELVSELEIQAGYNELKTSEIQALNQTRSLDEGIHWAEQVARGVKPAITTSNTTSSENEPKTNPLCRLTSKGKCQWYLKGQAVTYSTLLNMGYSDIRLHEIKQQTLLPKLKKRVSNLPSYRDGQWYYLGEVVTVQQLHNIGFSDARLKEIQRKK